MIVKDALHKYAATQINRHRYRNRRTQKYIGASEIGLCIRRVWYAKQQSIDVLDPKHSDDVGSWGATRRGSTFEKHFWLPAMRKQYGQNLYFAGSSQVTMTLGNLRATPDGLLAKQPRNALAYLGVPDIGKSGCIVLECKTADPRIRLNGPKPEHEFQTQVQIGLFREASPYRPDYALISYVNASFYDDVLEFPIKFDPAVFDVAKRRAAMILAADSAEQLKPEGWIGGGTECKWCPFIGVCSAVRVGQAASSEQGKVPPQDIASIVALARQEREIATKASGLDTEQRNLQHQIKSRLSDLGLRQIDSDGIRIIWSPVKGRPAYDMPKLRAAAAALGLNIEEYSTVGDPTDRLVITLLSQRA